MEKNHSAIALFSGGLDSILCVKWMLNLGYKVAPLFFSTPYLPRERAMESAERNSLTLTVIDITDEHLKILNSPRYGYGKNINPCIDCHGLMFRQASLLMHELQADFLISGEVLGQRPMSQRKDSLNAVGKLSGIRDLIVRPLCQKLLPDTLPIREGWVDKEELLDFSGRSRKRQVELAKKLGVEFYPHPAGGCLLTDINYTRRIRDLQNYNQVNPERLTLLRFGRHLRISPTVKLIIGRDEIDCLNIENNACHGIALMAKDHTGPLGLIVGDDINVETITKCASYFLYYNKKASEVAVVQYKGNTLDGEITVEKADKHSVEALLI